MAYDQTLETPMNQKTANMLVVELDVFKLEAQQTNTKDQSFIIKVPAGLGPYKFYAPNEVFENITHSWEEHDTMAGRLGQLVTDVQEGGKEITTGFSTGGSAFTGNQRFKIDAPLIWKNSPRREYSIPFVLLNQNDPQAISQVVLELKRMSSAKASPNLLSGIEMPHIFRIRTVPGSLLYVESCALTGVQATYHMPFINGYPTKIDLQLTFIDLMPLFEHSFDGGGGSVTTNQP